MSNKKCTIIEIVADFIYFVMTGTQLEINEFCKTLKNKYNNYDYISIRLDIPISFTCDTLEKNY